MFLSPRPTGLLFNFSKSVVNTQGELAKEKGIVADRIKIGTIRVEETVIGDDNIFAE